MNAKHLTVPTETIHRVFILLALCCTLLFTNDIIGSKRYSTRDELATD